MTAPNTTLVWLAFVPLVTLILLWLLGVPLGLILILFLLGVGH